MGNILILILERICYTKSCTTSLPSASVAMPDTRVGALTMGVSNINIEGNSPQVIVAGRHRRTPTTSRPAFVDAKPRHYKERGRRVKDWGLLKEYQARTRNIFYKMIGIDKYEYDAMGRPRRARTTGRKTIEKMTEAIFWAVANSEAINLRAHPLFLPVMLKKRPATAGHVLRGPEPDAARAALERRGRQRPHCQVQASL